MKKHYDDETLQKINESADLIGYVSQTLDLKKKGNDYFAHCPKHRDDTPSLSFNSSENLFYCFSCGRSGGIIGYLIEYEGLPFEEAVEKAARLASVDLGQVCQSETMAFLKRMKMLSQKTDEPYSHDILSQNLLDKYSKENAQEWINEGIQPQVMELFGIRIDSFQNRIIYPVYDLQGNLINIKGRTRYSNYKALKIPKYINYYSVGCMDYFQGLNITLPYIKEKNEIIIVESIKSVMKLYGWGWKNAASAEKHTLTKEQMNILIKLRVNIVFAYDSDVDYFQGDVRKSIDKLKRITNVYLIKDRNNLLGGAEAKNAPVDLGEEVWEELYEDKRKVV